MMNSLILKPQPYVSRAIFIASQRNDVKSILLSRQKLVCTSCLKPLINWDAVFKWDSQDFDNLMGILAMVPLIPEESEQYKATPQIGNKHENLKGVDRNILPGGLDPKVYNSKTINLLDSRGQNWLENTQVDHKVPLILGGKVPALKGLLSNVDNLQLLHKQCHQNKTKLERENLISLYRKTRRDINNTPIKEMDTQTLERATLETVVKLYEKHKLQELLGLEQKDARRLEKMYQIAKKNIKKHAKAKVITSNI